MAFCNQCGHELAEDAKFCSNCGKSVSSNATDQRQTVYDGKLHKCPNCGEIISSFVITCPSCGYELRDASSAGAVQEFARAIAGATDDAQRARLIRNFVIPNTKENVWEFIILAATNAETSDMTSEMSEAWLTKLDQCRHKADLMLQNDPNYSKIVAVYEKAYKKLKSDKAKKKLMTAGRTGKKVGGFLGKFVGRFLGKRIFPALPQCILVFVAVYVFYVALGIDRTGGNGVGYELLGGLILLLSASMLGYKKANFLNFIANSIAGVSLFKMAGQFHNGVLLQLVGGINFLYVIICFIEKLVENLDGE